MDLTDEHKAILDFEAQQFVKPGAKEAAIVATFGMLAPAYWAKLMWLVDQPEAMEYSPLLCSRLRRLRDARAAARAAR